jgi:simple sugar transport system ATP-binding protein
MSLSRNALLTAYQSGLLNGGFIDFAATDAYATRVRDDYDVRSSGIEAEARSLSGGNLQKFIIGREVMQDPELLVLGHPTWGVDVGAATTIHQVLVDMARDGASIVVVSEDLDELFEICDTVAVIAGGRLSPARPVAETTVEEVGLWMSGQFDARAGEVAHA